MNPHSTSNTEYVQIYKETIQPYTADWEFIFTDGSKSDTSTTFALTNKIGVTIAVFVLPLYCSIFTAETAAILEAVFFASSNGKKTIICSDSKSAINVILNQSNYSPLITKIKTLIYKYNDIIKIMWTPGHAGIQGNEVADNWAKETNKKLLHASPYFTTKDIKNYVKQHITDCCLNDWRHSNHHYKLSNPFGQQPQFSNSITCKNIKTFIRIRIRQTYMSLLWFGRLHNTSYPR